jgi:hypothetical protein
MRVVSFAEMILEIQLLADAGHCKAEPADDAESQKLAADGRRLNRDWKPGEIPRVPKGYRDGRALRVRIHAPTRLEPARAAARTTRPRERRATTRRLTRAGPSRDDPSEPEPPPLARPGGHLSVVRERL